jgi:hypothetical protein
LRGVCGSTAESLVQSPLKPIEEKVPDPVWRLLSLLLLIIGLTAIVAVVRSRNLKIAWLVFVNIGVYVLTLAGLLKAVEAIGKSFRMKGQTDEETKTTGIGDEKE